MKFLNKIPWLSRFSMTCTNPLHNIYVLKESLSTPLNAIQFEEDLSIAVMPQQQLKTLSHTMLVTTALKMQFEKMPYFYNQKMQ